MRFQREALPVIMNRTFLEFHAQRRPNPKLRSQGNNCILRANFMGGAVHHLIYLK
jgi:hypothetical protein